MHVKHGKYVYIYICVCTYIYIYTCTLGHQHPPCTESSRKVIYWLSLSSSLPRKNSNFFLTDSSLHLPPARPGSRRKKWIPNSESTSYGLVKHKKYPGIALQMKPVFYRNHLGASKQTTRFSNTHWKKKRRWNMMEQFVFVCLFVWSLYQSIPFGNCVIFFNPRGLYLLCLILFSPLATHRNKRQ